MGLHLPHILFVMASTSIKCIDHNYGSELAFLHFRQPFMLNDVNIKPNILAMVKQMAHHCLYLRFFI